MGYPKHQRITNFEISTLRRPPRSGSGLAWVAAPFFGGRVCFCKYKFLYQPPPSSIYWFEIDQILGCVEAGGGDKGLWGGSLSVKRRFHFLARLGVRTRPQNLTNLLVSTPRRRSLLRRRPRLPLPKSKPLSFHKFCDFLLTPKLSKKRKWDSK